MKKAALTILMLLTVLTGCMNESSNNEETKEKIKLTLQITSTNGSMNQTFWTVRRNHYLKVSRNTSNS